MREDGWQHRRSVVLTGVSIHGHRPCRTTVDRITLMHVLFVCSQNRLRSPTAERVFAAWEGIEVASAGLSPTARVPLTAELLGWADLVFVMEKAHRSELSARFRDDVGGKRVICLDIPDEFEYMDPILVDLLKARVSRHLPRP